MNEINQNTIEPQGDQINQPNLSNKPALTQKQQQVYDLHLQQLTQSQIANKLNLSIGYVNRVLFYCKRKGYVTKKYYPSQKDLQELKCLREQVIRDLKEKLKWSEKDLEEHKQEINNATKEELQELLNDIIKKASQ